MNRYLILFLLFPIIVSAQSNSGYEIGCNVSDQEVEPTPVGVDEMKYIGNQYITHDDSTLMNYITRIVQNDIGFHADFKFIAPDKFYMKMYEIKELDISYKVIMCSDYISPMDQLHLYNAGAVKIIRKPYNIDKIKTTVHVSNEKMLKLNEKLGYEPYMLNMVKTL